MQRPLFIKKSGANNDGAEQAPEFELIHKTQIPAEDLLDSQEEPGTPQTWGEVHDHVFFKFTEVGIKILNFKGRISTTVWCIYNAI